MKQLLMTLFIALTMPLSSIEYVTVNFEGCQFGNQMFQIAAALSLAIDNDAHAIFPELATRTDSGFPKNYKDVFFRLDVSNPKLRKKKTYREPHHHYAPIPYQPNIVLKGYFQSEKYFKHNADAILPLFAPSESISQYITNKYGHLLSHTTKVGIHLRSYLIECVGVQKHLPTYGAEYYEKAMEKFPEDTIFLVCSNDISWVKNLFQNIHKNIVYIEGNDYIQDFYLLSMCHHQIICNSTFSWWAAYLNTNPNKKIIAPPHFFRPGNKSSDQDIFPESWETIYDLEDPFLPIKKK